MAVLSLIPAGCQGERPAHLCAPLLALLTLEMDLGLENV